MRDRRVPEQVAESKLRQYTQLVAAAWADYLESCRRCARVQYVEREAEAWRRLQADLASARKQVYG